MSTANPPFSAKTSPNRRKRPNTKRTGELAEAAFVVKAASLGFAVSKPWGDSERYDFILDAGHRTFRVQVKCTESINANAYQVQSTYTDGNHKGHYTAADIDVLVGYVLPFDLWYVVPVDALPGSASLRFYPKGSISKRVRFEQYREAWQVFREPVASETITHTSPASTISTCAASSCAPAPVCHSEQSEEPAFRNSTLSGATNSNEDTAESPMERTMGNWAKRVHALYNRKR
jgi:hypothetical protein